MRSHSTLPLGVWLWPRVDRTGDCWLWTSPDVTTDGYGRIRYGGKNWRAHRLVYTLLVGPIPSGMEVCHNCPGGDNPLCVRPEHLWLGTTADNQADKKAKGRGPIGERNARYTHPESTPRGEQHGNAKFTDGQIREIRERYRKAKLGRKTVPRGTVQTLCQEFGITPGYVWKVVHGNWRASVGHDQTPSVVNASTTRSSL